MNPNIVEPAGPIDPEVGVLGAWDRDSESFLGCVVNFACHGTAAGFDGSVTGDWITHMVTTVQGAMGAVRPVVFLNGAAGDVAHIDMMSESERETGRFYAKRLGGRVGAEAVKVLLSAVRALDGCVDAQSVTLDIERRGPSDESVREAEKALQQGLEPEGSNAEWVFAKERVIAGYLKRSKPIVDVEVQALQVGPVVYLANPSEYFCANGLRIKEGSVFPLTYVVELANGRVGYVPTSEAFGPSGGGYETVLTAYSNLAVDAGDRIAEAAIDLAARLRQTPLPKPPRVPLPDKVWNYGTRGPEME